MHRAILNATLAIDMKPKSVSVAQPQKITEELYSWVSIWSQKLWT